MSQKQVPSPIVALKFAGARYNAFRALTAQQRAEISNYTYSFNTSAIIAGLLADPSISDLYLPPGGWLITSQISIPNLKRLSGAGFGLSAGQAATRILKRGAFNGVLVNAGSALENLSVEGDTGNTLDGVALISGRSRICNVSSFLHGQDGFKIGPYSAGGNANLWDLRGLISRSNTRHGMLIEHTGETTLPNVNAGILTGFEASFNGGDGLKLGSTVDNQLYGVVCQNNTGWGVHYAQYAKGNFMPMAYTEVNTAGDTVYDTGADRNFLVGFRSGLVNDGIVNNGAENLIIGRSGSISGYPLHRTAEAWFDLRVFDGNAVPTSGQWRFTKANVTRDLVVEMAATSATADMLITNTGGGAAGLRFVSGVASNDAAMRAIKTRTGVTLNFGTIAANTCVDVTVAITGADATYGFTATPIFAAPANVSWCAFWDGVSAVKVRACNHTAAGIAFSGAFNVTAYKIV